MFRVPDTGVKKHGAAFADRVLRGSSRHVDIAAMLSGGLPEPPTPSVLHRTDGPCLFYAAQVNLLFGDPESGKTLIALAALSELAAAGAKSAFLDLDHNGPDAIVGRLLASEYPRRT